MLRFCVSGARRGGGVGGIPVHNAAMAVLAGRRDVTGNEASAVSYAPRSGAGDDRLDIRRRRQSRTGASQSAFLMSCASVYVVSVPAPQSSRSTYAEPSRA